MTPLLLTEALPLRKTSQLGTFEEDAYLALRYGDLRKSRFILTRLGPTTYAAAGHAMEITRAFVDNLETKGFAFAVKADSLGNPRTEVEFGAPIPPGSTVTACGIGKRNPLNGAVIENPADIAVDVMAFAGRTDPWWGQLRSDCSQLGIALAGSFTEPATIQEHIDTIVDSAGGMWCYGMAQVYPLPIGADTFVLPLDRHDADDLKVSASLVDTADVLKLFYAYDEALGRAGSFVEVSAKPQRFGGAEVEITLPMLRGAAAAEATAIRLLARKAGERYDVALTTPTTEFIWPGTWVRLDNDPRWPFAGNPFVKIISVTRDQPTTTVRGEAVLTTPAIEVIGHSIGTDGIEQGGVEVTQRDGELTFTVRDQDGRPLPGARVSFDGGAPRTTNASGQVTFPYTKGDTPIEHELVVEMAGKAPQTLTVLA